MRDLVLIEAGTAAGTAGTSEPETSLSYLQSIYRDPFQPMSVRMRAAIQCLPFENPRLAVIANVNNRDMGNQLEARIARRLGRD